jgi:16S rRNA (cytidine1402-2'-O)-methyltransferase
LFLKKSNKDISYNKRMNNSLKGFLKQHLFLIFMLYVVSTPIGNIEDITIRAINTLKKCDVVLCEDSRRTSKLLNHYDIKKQLIIYNDINKKKVTEKIIKLLKEKKILCLVSDGGTPLINDPGYYLVRECIKNNIDISPLPGPTSIISGLVCSGIPVHNFSYMGFVPKTSGKRKTFLEKINKINITTIVLESPYRILKTLEQLKIIMPNKKISIGRELTKKFEEFIRGYPQEVFEKLNKSRPKGEFVLIISGEISRH